MIKHNSDILNKLFFRELQMLIEKYNKIDEKDRERIEGIITNLKDEDLQSYLMKNIDKLLDILTYTDEINESCPKCNSNNIQRLRRITGYLNGDYKTSFNKGKQQEVLDRVKHIK